MGKHLLYGGGGEFVRISSVCGYKIGSQLSAYRNAYSAYMSQEGTLQIVGTLGATGHPHHYLSVRLWSHKDSKREQTPAPALKCITQFTSWTK